MGLSDTGNLNISGGSGNTDAAGDLQLKNGLGIDIQSTGTFNVNSGLSTLGGELDVTGTVDINSTQSSSSNTTGALKVDGGLGLAENLNMGGNLTVDGSANIKGSVTLGDAATDNVTINADVNSNIIPNTTGTYNLGSVAQKWGTVYADAIVGISNVTANITGNVTGNVSGSSGSCTGNAATASLLQTARNIGGVSFNGGANIDLPGVNTAGNQNTSGTATQADNINIDESNTNGSFQVTFSANNNAGYSRQYIDTDDGHFIYNPGTYSLSGLNQISASSFQGTTFGTASQNAYGARYVSTNGPSGGSDGDIWYKY